MSPRCSPCLVELHIGVRDESMKAVARLDAVRCSRRIAKAFMTHAGISADSLASLPARGAAEAVAAQQVDT